MTMCGEINIILGCMRSGKTTHLISEWYKWNSISKNAICINFAEDVRYGIDPDHARVYSHDLLNVKCINALTLKEIDDIIIAEKDCNVVLINEGQFFPDLLKYVIKWCEEHNKNILISGLDGDYLRKPFGQILDLIPYANKVKKLKAFCSICKDGTHAHFTKRITDDIEQKIIGNDIYVSVCRKHYLE
jgi:thymidine kinase